jgi:hypothetical protein
VVSCDLDQGLHPRYPRNGRTEKSEIFQFCRYKSKAKTRIHKMIDIQKNFDTKAMSDVAFAAMETFAESGCDLIYLQDIYTELQKHEHWLLQLQWLFYKMEKKNFAVLSEKLNYDPVQLTQAFRVICRIPQL